MAGYLNPGNVGFQSILNGLYVDKSNLIAYVNHTLDTPRRLTCVSRPRRFRKSFVVFIDEIESALHPTAISEFLDIIDRIASDMGIQFFIASHSYFVIKKLYLIALKRKQSIPCISLSKDKGVQYFDMLEGMPKNSIINESIRLYEEEIEEVLG